LRCAKKIGETMMREFLSQYSIVSLVFLAALWSGGRGDSYTGELFGVAGDALRGSADIQLGGPASMQGNPVNPEDFIDARLVRELDKSGFIDRL
jgi:hypothetical protein